MRKVPLRESLRIIGRGSLNWLAERPIVVSFEVTDACTCYCKHCDHGGPRDESRNLQPADYRRYMEALRPCVVQVSGGEPLMRDDVVEIVRAIKGCGRLPYTILVSNWSLMTEEKYLELRAAGVDQFSVSLDFPDERHDDFRGYPGLYRHLEDLIPRLARAGARRYRAQQLHHQREPGGDRRHRRQGARVGRESLLQRLFGAAHGMPRLFPGAPEQLAETERAAGPRGGAARPAPTGS